MRGDRPLWLAVIGYTCFNFLGALMLLNLFFHGADVLHVGETHIGLLNVSLALGIAKRSAEPLKAARRIFIHVENFPWPGTGKLNLRGVKALAQRLLTTDGHGHA
jgi:hypothetical protein